MPTLCFLPSNAYFLVIENYEVFEDFRSSPVWVPTIQTGISLCSAPFTITNVATPPSPPTDIFEGPVVTLGTLNFRPDSEMSQIKGVLAKFSDLAKTSSDF